MRRFKINPDVSCCAYKSGVLHDKDRIYPETMWDPGEALERVKSGFLVEVKPDPKPDLNKKGNKEHQGAQ